MRPACCLSGDIGTVGGVMVEGWMLTAGAFVIGYIVWLVRLEGRVNGHDREHKEHKDRHDEMREDLAYIRQRIDKALNGKHS